jgi:putative toxin-antitoxin system antitoxin component (TIGR02293 family)
METVYGSDLIRKATEVFGSREKALAWVARPNRALGNSAPEDVLRSEAGARRVAEVLGRIEHGLFS